MTDLLQVKCDFSKYVALPLLKIERTNDLALQARSILCAKVDACAWQHAGPLDRQGQWDDGQVYSQDGLSGGHCGQYTLTYQRMHMQLRARTCSSVESDWPPSSVATCVLVPYPNMAH